MRFSARLGFATLVALVASLASVCVLILALQTWVGLATPLGVVALLLGSWTVSGTAIWSAVRWAQLVSPPTRMSARVQARAMAATAGTLPQH